MLLRQDERDAARMIIRALNPEADVIETNFSNAPLERILNTGRFDFERAQQHPLWFKELYGFADHTPETEEYGVEQFRLSRAAAVSILRNFINSCRKAGRASSAPRDISGSQLARNGSVS